MRARARRRRGVAAWGVFTAALLAASASSPRAALAFGVFTEDSSARVSSHRMALALQRDGTVMWDQVTWSARSPSRVVWLVPVRPGSTVELTGNAWFDALDATTAPVIYSPPDLGGGAGCALAGCNQDHVLGEGPGGLTVQRRATVGPIETARFSSAETEALFTWMTERRAAPADAMRDVIRTYAREGWELAALYLEPDCETTTRTVRVTSPRGTPSPVLPTRLLMAGASATVDVTLFTLGETRYAPAAFGTATIDVDRLAWDERDKKSNYDELVRDALSKSSGRVFLTEVADVPGRAAAGSRASFPVFYELYPALCGKDAIPEGVEVKEPTSSGTCRSPASDAGTTRPDASVLGDAGDAGDGGDDAGADAGDGGDPDAGDAGAGEPDAGGLDGGTRPRPAADSCAAPDDLVVGLRTLDPTTVTLTRMRATLSASALVSGDLALVPSDGFVTNQLQAVAFEDDKSNEPRRAAACVTTVRKRAPGWTAIGVSLFAIAVAWARRRTRR